MVPQPKRPVSDSGPNSAWKRECRPRLHLGGGNPPRTIIQSNGTCQMDQKGGDKDAEALPDISQAGSTYVREHGCSPDPAPPLPRGIATGMSVMTGMEKAAG